MKTLTQRREETKSQGNEAAKIWSAVTRHRFPPTRYVASFQSADTSAHSKTFCVSALQSLGIIVRREDFSGARTALSACFRRIGAFARTKLSALLWLRLRRAVPWPR
jgi:hypothetical protein